MIYLLDPVQATVNGCTTKCWVKCTGVCGIKPMYGVPPIVE